MKYIIGTRGSKLALAQAEYVCQRLSEAYAEDEFEIRIIKTKGDQILDVPLHEMGEKGIFVREIEEQLLSGEIHIGVHSMKDMPSEQPFGLMFAKSWKREDPRDALILREKKTLEELPEHAIIATGSKRREIQLKHLRADLEVIGIRGNVETRLRKMEEEKLDGLILAAAGLRRLGMEGKIARYFEAEEMVPAPAQGILALEIKEGEEQLLAMLNALSDAETETAAAAEREFLRQMGGSCHIPAGALLRQRKDGIFQMNAVYGREDGRRFAYAEACGTNPKELAGKAAAQIRRQMAGIVTLLGAGPGDPGLVTVKGLLAIRKADCIIYDRLIPPELLEEAKEGCELIYAGKASCHHTMKQEEINRLLVQKSMQYKKTVRLKGGDPYVFGRGGEEGIYLQEHGVPIEVIPGISSSIAGLAYAGIPITHRGMASGFHVVTAHDKNDKLAEIDFEAMARGNETCVFLMGLHKAGEITSRLMQAGMPPGTKAAAISKAATAGQKACISDLMHLADEITKSGLKSPAVIVVGEVVSLRKQLNFFENRPLFGRRCLIPKIGSKTTKLAELLAEQGAAVDEIQVGSIVPIRQAFTAEELRKADWLIFTSKNGVESFFENFRENGLDIRALAACKIAAVGRKTAEILKTHGLSADILPKEFHSGALIEALKGQLAGKEEVWHIKAANAEGYFKAALEGLCKVKEVETYENCPIWPDLGKLRPLSDYDGIFFTCASSAERGMRMLEGMENSGCPIYSIGPKTTAYLKAHGIKQAIQAEEASYEGMAMQFGLRLCDATAP